MQFWGGDWNGHVSKNDGDCFILVHMVLPLRQPWVVVCSKSLYIIRICNMLIRVVSAHAVVHGDTISQVLGMSLTILQLMLF